MARRLVVVGEAADRVGVEVQRTEGLGVDVQAVRKDGSAALLRGLGAEGLEPIIVGQIRGKDHDVAAAHGLEARSDVQRVLQLVDREDLGFADDGGHRSTIAHRRDTGERAALDAGDRDVDDLLHQVVGVGGLQLPGRGRDGLQ